MNQASVRILSGKRGMDLKVPWMNAAGSLGFSSEAASQVDLSALGALVTNPTSLKPRTPAHGPRLLPFTGGILLHTGLPNPGLDAVLQRHRRRWSKLPCPVIVHFLALDPAEVILMAEAIDGIEEIAAIEMGLPESDPDAAAALIQAAGSAQLPVLAQIPLPGDDEVARAAVQAGAAALVLAAPRGCLPAQNGEQVEGRLYGPSLYPQALKAVRRMASRLDCAVIAGAGIYSADQTQAMLSAGAAAVQFDTVLWTQPEAVLPPGPAQNRTGASAIAD